MRLPVKSETDAFRLTYAGAALIAVSLALGALAGPLYGVVLFAGVVIGAAIYGLNTADPDRRLPLREAAESAPGATAGARRRILVVANETLGGEELRAELLRLGEPRPELRVIAPVLPSRWHYVASDIDRELKVAGTRLRATLDWAAEQGFVATGSVNDAGPVVAIEDELRREPADGLIISTHTPQRSHWLETGVVERARAELDIPVTHVIVDLERQRVQVARGLSDPAA